MTPETTPNSQHTQNKRMEKMTPKTTPTPTPTPVQVPTIDAIIGWIDTNQIASNMEALESYVKQNILPLVVDHTEPPKNSKNVKPFTRMFYLSESNTLTFLIGVFIDLVKFRDEKNPLVKMAVNPNPVIYSAFFAPTLTPDSVHKSLTNEENFRQSFVNQLALLPTKTNRLMELVNNIIPNKWTVKVSGGKKAAEREKMVTFLVGGGHITPEAATLLTPTALKGVYDGIIQAEAKAEAEAK